MKGEYKRKRKNNRKRMTRDIQILIQSSHYNALKEFKFDVFKLNAKQNCKSNAIYLIKMLWVNQQEIYIKAGYRPASQQQAYEHAYSE